MPAPTLQVQITRLDDATVLIKLTGEARLDLEDAAFQLNRVVAFHPKVVLVDLTELTFLSSIGMSLLVNLRRTALKSNGVVKLAGLQPRIRDSMAHARLLELFEIFPDMAAATGTTAAPTDEPAPGGATPAAAAG